MLKAIAGVKAEKATPVEDLENKIRTEVVGRIAKGLMKLAGDNGMGIMDLTLEESKKENPNIPAPSPNGEYLAPWLETDFCTSCDECIKINPNIFAYNNDKKAYIKDPNAGPYSDLVKAAEKCTAGVIHPGLPADKNGPDMEKWIKRGEKFN
ncbi:ferredoxin [Cecembia calidifontis]|nr:ferredoxin [Cecembia calidifontis]